MKVNVPRGRKTRIEMIPLIDIVFLLLVFFIYTMLSMAVHRGLPVILPTSSTAKIRARGEKETGVLLFADRSLPYQRLFRVLDEIRMAGLTRISLQAEEVNRQR
jgi:biopolymer transport protein ExbD